MDEMHEPLFTTVKLEDFVPTDHPLRPIRLLVNEALKRLNGQFSVIYADTGRTSIAPERLLRVLLLQVFYSVRSERKGATQADFGLSMSEGKSLLSSLQHVVAQDQIRAYDAQRRRCRHCGRYRCIKD